MPPSVGGRKFIQIPGPEGYSSNLDRFPLLHLWGRELVDQGAGARDGEEGKITPVAGSFSLIFSRGREIDLAFFLPSTPG